MRNLDQEVQECLLDNFKKFNSKQTDQLAPESQEKLTLGQRLRRDKERLLHHDASAPTMGKRYYAVLRDAYQDWTSPSKRLKPEDDNDQSMDETLQDACLAITGSPVDVTPLNDFVGSSSKELTQMETVLLYQHVFRLDLRIEARVGLIMNVMKIVFRTKLHQRMPKEWQIMKDFYDRAL